MDTSSVAYVLCRIENDSSLTPVGENEDSAGGVAAGKHQVEVEDFDFGYGLYADDGRVAFLCLSIDVKRSITAEDVIETLATLFRRRGEPIFVRSDNGPEFVAKAIKRWLEAFGVNTLYIEPGLPGRMPTRKRS